MLSKFAYVCLFLALTLLHICAHLKPTIEAHASIKTINLRLTRKLNLFVGYEYHHSMLWQAVMNSLLFVFGVWLCQREVDRKRGRTIEQELKLNGHSKISAATEVKLNWLRTRGKRASSWQLFPKRMFAWFSMPWLSTFLLNEFCNYAQLNLIMKHFCTSTPEVLLLHVRVQLLYLQQLLSSIIGPYLLQFTGAFVSLTASHANYINYETNLFVKED
ncbi:uncharacterized protein LOC6583391 [Drosophila mojavensis]|uniref:Uncharacterized protein n=1 Tax=Drosophila mojavensis TaxID=7230 RepID=B4KVY6_DROMO|nr:uncharacterized protein LOC6583391 [Drosophila mojavensis]EDW19537.2 uncharacterized protein Dmoj_GI11470 [Drosophila mojavensis]